jgi:hypothetical protein
LAASGLACGRSTDQVSVCLLVTCRGLATRLSGLAFGLALAVRPAGAAEVSEVKGGARAHRLGDATGGEAGASLRELMNRMGHSSMRSALIYQHRTAQRDKMIAAAISERVSAELTDIDCPSGT